MSDSVIDLTNEESEMEEVDISSDYKNLLDQIGNHRNNETKYLMKERKWFNIAQEESNPERRQKYMQKAMKCSMKATYHRIETEELMEKFDYKLTEDIAMEDEPLWSDNS